jgi:hypothetical protein
MGFEFQNLWRDTISGAGTLEYNRRPPSQAGFKDHATGW